MSDETNQLRFQVSSDDHIGVSGAVAGEVDGSEARVELSNGCTLHIRYGQYGWEYALDLPEGVTGKFVGPDCPDDGCEAWRNGPCSTCGGTGKNPEWSDAL